MAAKSKRLLRALGKRMRLEPPSDMRDATNEQLARIIGVDAERMAAMSDEELMNIIDEDRK